MKCKKRPIAVEAMQFWGYPKTQTELEKFMAFCGEKAAMIWTEDYGLCLEIKTLEGTMRAQQGDYIIKGVRGELYPCRKDIFKETYEEVVDNGVD